MDIFKDIASKLSPERLAALARFREAAKTNTALPAEINELPAGFLAGRGFNDDFTALFVLTPDGMRVATAAGELARENAA